MADCHVIDTNVLMVASAADGQSPFDEGATPVDDPALRKRVLDWLISVDKSTAKVVLDWDWMICTEYLGATKRHRLCEQDYGWLMMMSKVDRGEVVWIGLETDKDGNAKLPITLECHVSDRADRKMVAAVLAAITEGADCNLVNSCDDDWYSCQSALTDHNVLVMQLLHSWLHPKWLKKQK